MKCFNGVNATILAALLMMFNSVCADDTATKNASSISKEKALKDAASSPIKEEKSKTPEAEKIADASKPVSTEDASKAPITVEMLAKPPISMEPSPATSSELSSMPEAPEAKAILPSVDEAKVQKELLDLARRGVAMVHVKTYATALGSSYDRNQKWLGTGFIVDKKNGLVATNRHVVGEMSVSTYELKFSDGTTLPAQLAYFDPVLDFAFLKVDPAKLPENALQLDFADKPIAVNETIFSLGNSAGEEFSMISGVVYNLYNSFGPFPEQTLQYSGITVGGASGSPVFNAAGKVVGIIYGGNFVTGAVLPASYLIDALKSLSDGNKKPVRKELGATFKYVNVDELLEAGLMDKASVEEYIKKFPHASKKILCIDGPIVNTPAFGVLRPGDAIWKVNGTIIGPELHQFTQLINQSSSPIDVEVLRNGKVVTLKIHSTDYDVKPYLRFVSFAGATFFSDSLHTRLFTGDKEPGVFISSITPASAFSDLGGQGWFGGKSYIKILEIDGNPIKNLDDIIKVIPKLHNEKRVEIRYLKMEGDFAFGQSVIADRLERFVILKYDPAFDSPKEYVFDQDAMKWNSADIKVKP